MKKLIILIVCLMCVLAACKQPNVLSDFQSSATSDNTGSNATALSGKETNKTNNAVLYNHVTAADMTDEQAQAIMAVIVPRQFEIFNIFESSGLDIADDSQVCPWDENYVLVTDEQFKCVQDIRNFVLKTMTEESAKELYFDIYLDNPYEPDNYNVNKYIDYEGNLYCSLHTGGKGFLYTMLPETSRIVARTENSVTIEMNTIYSVDTNDGWLYTPTLVKTKDGWRVDNSLTSEEGRYTN